MVNGVWSAGWLQGVITNHHQVTESVDSYVRCEVVDLGAKPIALWSGRSRGFRGVLAQLIHASFLTRSVWTFLHAPWSMLRCRGGCVVSKWSIWGPAFIYYWYVCTRFTKISEPHTLQCQNPFRYHLFIIYIDFSWMYYTRMVVFTYCCTCIIFHLVFAWICAVENCLLGFLFVFWTFKLSYAWHFQAIWPGKFQLLV